MPNASRATSATDRQLQLPLRPIYVWLSEWDAMFADLPAKYRRPTCAHGTDWIQVLNEGCAACDQESLE